MLKTDTAGVEKHVRVRCVRLVNHLTGEEIHRRHWGRLTVGNIYTVLEVFISISSRSYVHYRFLGDDEPSPGFNPSPALFDASQFEIVDHRLPSNWRFWSGPNADYFKLSPQQWQRCGFWEDYFDDVAEALRDFEVERAIIEAEAEHEGNCP